MAVVIYQTGSNWQETGRSMSTPSGAAWFEEAMRAGAELKIARVTEELHREFSRSRRGRACLWIMRTYTALLSRLSRRRA